MWNVQANRCTKREQIASAGLHPLAEGLGGMEPGWNEEDRVGFPKSEFSGFGNLRTAPFQQHSRCPANAFAARKPQ